MGQLNNLKHSKDRSLIACFGIASLVCTQAHRSQPFLSSTARPQLKDHLFQLTQTFLHSTPNPGQKKTFEKCMNISIKQV